MYGVSCVKTGSNENKKNKPITVLILSVEEHTSAPPFCNVLRISQNFHKMEHIRQEIPFKKGIYVIIHVTKACVYTHIYIAQRPSIL